MIVRLHSYTPLNVAISAIRTCWDSQSKSNPEADAALLNRIVHKHKHLSTIEHLIYNFEIFGISRGCLQELVRHRLASYSVKSTRYTLKELLNSTNMEHFIVKSNNNEIDSYNIKTLEKMKELKESGVPNDTLKYMLPEAFKTHLHFSINARSLRNFFELRLKKDAHFEIRKLANLIFQALPKEHSQIFEDFLPMIQTEEQNA